MRPRDDNFLRPDDGPWPEFVQLEPEHPFPRLVTGLVIVGIAAAATVLWELFK